MKTEEMFALAMPGLKATAKSYNVELSDPQFELIKTSYLEHVAKHGTSRGWLITVFRPWLAKRMSEQAAKKLEVSHENVI